MTREIIADASDNMITIYPWIWGQDKKTLDLGIGMVDITKSTKYEL
jgi:hypothetical protein